MSDTYLHLGVYSDWVAEARRQQPLYPLAAPGPETQRKAREVLGFCHGPEVPLSVRTEHRWERDGLIGEEVSWWVGYGPRTHAYVIKPSDATPPLPGVVALHDHGGFKFYGKEKIADGPDNPPLFLQNYRRQYYGGRAWANALAKEGFVVLVHDTFLWGSRRFPYETMPQDVRQVAAAVLAANPPDPAIPREIAEYNVAAAQHEHWMSKYANILGTSMAGVVCHEDRIAVNYLLSRPDVLSDRVGCMGLSGGGNRAVLLQATHDRMAATGVIGLMSTYPGLLDHNMSHTWMFFPFGWARYGDWPDLAACRAPSPLLVQYDLEDDLFTLEGMKAADARLAALYQSVGHPEAYVGQFYPGPHKFDLEMQSAAFGWLKRWLG
jgi:dienelactone hydrolase